MTAPTTGHLSPSPGEVAASRAERVTRAPTDVLRLVVASLALVLTVLLGGLFDNVVIESAAGLLRGLDALPDSVTAVVGVAGAALAMLLLGATVVVATRQRDGRLLAAPATAALLAAALLVVLRRLLGGDVAVSGLPPQPLFGTDEMPALVATAVTTAAVTAVAPWMPRRWRRGAWTVVLILAAATVGGNPTAFEPLVAVEAGWVAGAAMVVAFGAPSRRPPTTAVAAGLAAVGTPLARMERVDLDARGSTPYRATAGDGTSLFVKVLGEDERSADLLFRLWRSVQPRDLGDERPFSSLRRAVEHEALVALVARDAGARTPRLVAVAAAAPHGWVLAYDAIGGRSFDRLADDELTGDVLAQAWDEVRRLHERGIAHRDLRLANLFLGDDGHVWAIDFGFSELAATDLLLDTDVAELVASSATAVGARRAVAGAVAAMGPEAVARARARLRPRFLSGATRRALKGAPDLLPAVWAEVAAQTGDGAGGGRTW